MKVLVIGGGGREHTIVWKLAQSPSVSCVHWTPGNAAARPGSKVVIQSVKADNVRALADLAQQEKIDLAIAGPEAPLVAGVGDEFQRRGLAIFGPSRQGAQLEGSKVFSKQFFLKHGVPTGRAVIFSDFNEALAHVRRQPKPLVIKADGLAAGKGVTVCADDHEAEQALDEAMRQKVFGESGRQVLVEECLSGPEVSVHAITDGRAYRLLVSAQDHKRALDGDHGPNTGGMGAYSPAPIFTPELEARVRTEIFDRTLAGLRAEGIPYCGVLYAGLMLTKDGPKILEYNCRLGDPETQVLLTRLDGDLAAILMAACRGGLEGVEMKWKREAAVCVVLAAGGYPGPYRKGDAIGGLEEAARLDGVHIFHAGTALHENKVVTAGGRVLGVTAIGANLRDAIHRAYQAADTIQFEGKQCRRDIAAKACP
ncbi:MAG: phosphoribosylamine--glycine ligase [Verrucomicrobia bacterium]|nr:phosphoribosylamine--glycine ligase [Verrucomicrobiota bacterium]